MGTEGTVHGRKLAWGRSPRGQPTGGGSYGDRGDSPQQEACVGSQSKDTVHAGSSRGVAIRSDSPWQEACVGSQSEGTVHGRRPVWSRSSRTQSTQEACVGSQFEDTVHGRKLVVQEWESCFIPQQEAER